MHPAGRLDQRKRHKQKQHGGQFGNLLSILEYGDTGTNSKRFLRFGLSGSNTGKDVAMGGAIAHADRAPRCVAQHKKAHSDAVVEMHGPGGPAVHAVLPHT